MRISLVLIPLGVLALAGCNGRMMAPTPASSTAPVTSTAPAGNASQSVQPPNSVPAGTAVNAPVTSGTGVVGQTRVR